MGPRSGGERSQHRFESDECRGYTGQEADRPRPGPVSPGGPDALLGPGPIERINERCVWLLKPRDRPLGQRQLDSSTSSAHPGPRRMSSGSERRVSACCARYAAIVANDCRLAAGLTLDQHRSGRRIFERLRPIQLDDSLRERSNRHLGRIGVLSSRVEQREQQRRLVGRGAGRLLEQPEQPFAERQRPRQSSANTSGRLTRSSATGRPEISTTTPTWPSTAVSVCLG